MKLKWNFQRGEGEGGLVIGQIPSVLFTQDVSVCFKKQPTQAACEKSINNLDVGVVSNMSI